MRGFQSKLAFMVAYGVIGFFSGGAHAADWYVDWAKANDSGAGNNWTNAKRTLSAAISAAGGSGNIFVKGSATPDQAVYAPTDGSPAVTDTFLINGLSIYGGFPPGASYPANLTEAAPETYYTYLSGDLENSSDFSEHVVSATSGSALLKGFIILDGVAGGLSAGDHDRGAGIYISGPSPTISNCVIRGNYALGYGGGMCIAYGAATITECLFPDNAAAWGGGIYAYATDAILYGCVFETNLADRGGALYLDGYLDEADISYCDFIGNSAYQRGGAVDVDNTSPAFSYCLFEENDAPSGGGVYSHLGFPASPGVDVGPHFEHCDFVGNVAYTATEHEASSGGGVTLHTDVPEGSEHFDDTEFTDCDFIENRVSFISVDYCQNAGLGAGMVIQGSPLLTDCHFIGNGPWNGDCNEIAINGGAVAISNFRSTDVVPFTAEFVDCVFRQNGHVNSGATEPDCTDTPDDVDVIETDFVLHGGAVYIQRPGPTANPFSDEPGHDAMFTGCIFIGNASGNGAGVFMDRASAAFDDCCWMDNVADGRTAHVWYGDDEDEFPCEEEELEYVQPFAAYGGGALSTYRLSYFNLLDCKFVRNTASLWSGGAIYVYQGTTMDVDRCYFVGNSAPSPQITQTDPPSILYTNNNPGTGGAIWVNTECLNERGGCEGSGIAFEHAVANVNNSLLVGNSAEFGEGGAIYNEKAGQCTLVNCTVMNNFAAQTGGILADSEPHYNYYDQACLTEAYNCIIDGNEDDSVEYADDDLRAQLWDEEGDPNDPNDFWPTAGYSCLQNDGTPDINDLPGPDHNIDDDPLIPVAITSGGWDSATYDSVTGTTTLTDNGADVTNWLGKVIVTRSTGTPATYEFYSLVVSVDVANDRIKVLGDVSLGNYTYDVKYYLIPPASPCDAAGNITHLPVPARGFDIIGNDRTIGTLDMGCYENQVIPDP